MFASMMDSLEELVDSTSALTKECTVTEFQCRADGCGKACKSTDEGANSFMRLCNACYIILRSDLEDQDIANTPELEGIVMEESPEDSNIPGASLADTQGIPEIPNDTAESNEQPMTMEEISTSLRLVVQARDARQTVKIRFGICVYVY
jgi:hypothetical protein